MKTKYQKWIYAIVVFSIELTFLVIGLLFLYITYSTFLTDATPNMLLDYQGNLGSNFKESLVELSPKGEDYFGDVYLSPSAFSGKVYFKKFIPIFYLQTVIGLLIYFLAFRKLYGLIKSAARGDFFTYKNVKRLNWIGVLFICWWLYEILLSRISVYILENYLTSTVLNTSTSQIQLIPNILESSLLIGFMILMLAQGFSYGLKLQREQELTI